MGSRLGGTPCRLPQLLALLGAICALAACGPASNGTDRVAARGEPDTVVTRDPARTFAPAVYFHPDERHFPIAAETLIAHASLKWAGGRCPDRLVATGPQADGRRTDRKLTPELLHDDSIRLRSLTPACRPRIAHSVYMPKHDTRPYRWAYRADDLPIDQGYYLDLGGSTLRGTQPQSTDERPRLQVPAYVEHRPYAVEARPALQLVYWLPFGATRPVVSGHRPPRLAHEGGWERIIVLLQRGKRPHTYVPIWVRYYTHAGHHTVQWRDVPRVRDVEGSATHPVALAARGSHALYPTPGPRLYAFRPVGRRYYVEDDAVRCAKCPVWRTWTQLRDVETTRWNGFGGSWGEPGPSDASSGPPGPSPYIYDQD